MRAKFSGVCRRCQGSIARGEEIKWTKAKGAEHQECPTAPVPVPAKSPVVRKRAPRQPSPPKVEGEFTVERDSRDRNDRYDVGDCSYFGKVNGGCYGVIIEAGKYKDDDDDQWKCWARVRPATEEEIAPVRAQREAELARKADVERLGRIHDEVRRQSIERWPQLDGRTIDMGSSGEIVVVGEDVYARHPGFYDDWRATHGHVKNPVLATEILAIADRLRKEWRRAGDPPGAAVLLRPAAEGGFKQAGGGPNVDGHRNVRA